MNISFRNEISANYMVIENVKEFSAKDFAVKMISQNRIESLLGFDYEVVNGKADILYDISSHLFFTKAFAFAKMNFEDMKTLLHSLNYLLRNLHAYLLDPDDVILKKECIFLDPQRRNYSFCYFPYYGGNFLLEVRELFAELLAVLDYNDRRAVRLAYDLQKASLSETFTFDEAIRMLETISVDKQLAEEAPREEVADRLVIASSSVPVMPRAQEEDGFFKKAGRYFKQTNPQDIFDDFNELKIVRKIRNYNEEEVKIAAEREEQRTKEKGRYQRVPSGTSEDLPRNILDMQNRFQEEEQLL